MRLLRFTRNLAPHYAIVAVFSVAVALSGIAGAFVIGKAADTVVHAVRSGREGEEAFAQVRFRAASSVCAPTRIPTAGSVCDNARDDAAFPRCRE